MNDAREIDLPEGSGSADRSVDEHPARGSLWAAGLAAVWLVGFLLYFYSQSLPNNAEISRLEVWRELHWHLLLATLESGAPSGWSYLPQRFDLILVASIIMAGAWGAGHLILRAIAVPLTPDSADRTVFAWGTGLSALSLATLACGLAGWLSRPLLGSLIVACVAAECILRLRGRGGQPSLSDSSLSTDDSRVHEKAPRALLQRRLLFWGCVAVVTPFLLAMFLGSMLPSVDFDVKEYHLQGPKEYFQNGRVGFLPHNVYTSFPFLTEMLSLLAMVLRDDWYRGALAGKAVLMCFAPLTALALYAAGRRWFGPAVGWIAALVYLTTPWTYRISTIAYTEGAQSFYLFAALLAAMIGIERLAKAKPCLSQFLLTGLLAGNAMACKYPGVLSVVIPLGVAIPVAAALLAEPGQNRVALALRTVIVFGLGTAVTVGPWLIKNTVETGNPVYPLVYGVFGGRDIDAALDAKFRAGHRPAPLRGYGPNPHNLSELPARVRDVTAKNDWLSPLLYGLAPLALLVVGRRRITIPLWLFVAYLFLTWWIFTHRIDRFWVPMLPLVALLAGIGAACSERLLWRVICGFGIAAAVLFNLALIVSPNGICGYNAFLIDLDSAREYSARLTTPDVAFLNQLYDDGQLPGDFKLLAVGEAEVFDARFPLVYNTVFDHELLQHWTAPDEPGTPPKDLPFRDAGQIRETLQQQGITHVLVNWQEILRYRRSYGYTDFVTPDRFRQLQELGVLHAHPLTFAAIDVAGLSEEKQQQLRDKLPMTVTASDGTRLTVSGTVNLDAEDRAQLKKWAPSLLRTVNGQQVFIRSQIFRVIR